MEPRAAGLTGFLFSSCMSADPDRCATIGETPVGFLVRLNEAQNQLGSAEPPEVNRS